MKFFSAIFLIAASLLISAEAAIKNPAEVIAKINELKAGVFNYQGEISAILEDFRQRSGRSSDSAGYANRTLVVLEEKILKISAEDSEVRIVLDTQATNACIANLRSFLDQILELSGFATSNCIELEGDTSVGGSENFTSTLAAIAKDANALGEIFIKALIGRNIFTQGDEIIARIEELLKEQKETLTVSIAALQALEGQVGDSWETSFKALDTCMNNVIISVSDAALMVASQLPVCAKFGGRGARSAILPNPKAFFPQLQ